MPTIPLPLVGPTYQNRSLRANNQVTQNFHIVVNKEGGEPVALEPFPGLKPFATTTTGTDRGMGKHQGVGYKVTGNSLYSFNSLGDTTLIGSIPGNGRCILKSDGNVLVITYGTGKPITWDGSTLVTGSDVDLPDAYTVDYINRRVVYDGAGSALAFSDLNQALTVNSFNVTSVNTSPTSTLSVVTQDQQLIVFSEDNITPYYNSGSGNPPYAVIQNATRKTGLGARYSIAQDSNFIYFLDEKLVPSRYSGLQVQPIGNPAIGRAIASYPDAVDGIGMTFTLDNENYYYLTFPQSASWLYKENVGWTSLAYGNGDPHLMNSYLRLYGKHLVGDRLSGNIYELDFETYTDNSEEIHHQRDTAIISGKVFGKPGARIFMDRLELIVEGGTSLISGQGSDAKVMMTYSDDFGNTWSPERWAPIGEQGEYGYKVMWDSLGSFYNRMFRFKMSDPVKWSLISLSADMELEL